MKIPEKISEFNSLTLILKILDSREPIQLTKTVVDAIAAALSLGKIECEDREEVIRCLEVMEQMEIIKIIKKEEEEGFSYLIGNLYNGK
jgi:hypothetical protein